MKKSLIALAVMAAAGAASAQSSVTLFGIVDAALTYGRGGGATGSNRLQLTSGAYNSSRIGFRGTEDLGGGMSASFWLEAGINADNGSGLGTNTNNQASGAATAGTGTQGLTFGRRSTLSLGGGWGELRLGRDYVPQFWNLTVFDPFGSVGVGVALPFSNIITGVTSTRASNSIGYFFPRNLGGFYGQVQYYLGENVNDGSATEDDGEGYGARVGFASGPFNLAVGYGRTEYAAGDVRQMNVGGQWDFGIAKLMGQMSRDRNGAIKGRGFLVGALMPVGAGELRVSYSQYKSDGAVDDPRARKLAVGYVHNLSKRTALYTTIAAARNRGGSALSLGGSSSEPNTNSSGLDIGIRHSF